MSTQAPAAAEAHAALHQGVYLPVFFTKLAEFPHVPVPQTEEDVEALLRIAGRVRHAHDTQTVKQAAEANPFNQAERLLDQLLTKSAAAEPDIDRQIEIEAQRVVASNPALAKAAVEWQNAVAQEHLDAQSNAA